MVLFICHGNVARSQFAEALYKKHIGPDACSAGTHVRPEKEGILLKDEGDAALTAAAFFKEITGIDLSLSRRKAVTREMADRADRIIVLTDREHLPDFLLGRESDLIFWAVPDPRDMDRSGYARIIDVIRQRIMDLPRTWSDGRERNNHESR